jgi:hypothetical protein
MSDDQIKKNETGMVYSLHVKRKITYIILVGKPKRKRRLRRRKLRLEDNIKTDHQEVEWVTWTDLILLKKRTGHRLL